MKRHSTLFILLFFADCLLYKLNLNAHRDYFIPKREFRGVWIATINNLDWPLGSKDNPEKQQRDLLTILDAISELGINTVIFQVRPASDAFYKSSIEPWSQWLMGEQDKITEYPFDPLAFIISECHKRGIELHAWFNPYRAVANTATAKLSERHISILRPDLIREYANGAFTMKILDPGEPETIEHIVKVVTDVVNRYDIDGVHFDDYFYPYPVNSLEFPDSLTFIKYGNGVSKGDWRRNNVTRLVRIVREALQVLKPKLKFGISPCGIWRNIRNDFRGSMTYGTQSYDDVYADSRLWLKEGIIDYVVPQVYWEFNNSLAPFDTVVSWWNENTFDRHLYIGHSLYKLNEVSNWQTEEIEKQILFNRTLDYVKGSALFSARQVFQNLKGVKNRLGTDVFSYAPLLPEMKWKDSIPPNSPLDVQLEKVNGEIHLSWKTPLPAPDGELPVRYIIYRADELPLNFNDIKSIYTLCDSANTSFRFKPKINKEMYFAVSSLDRLWNESLPSKILNIDTFKKDSAISTKRPIESPLILNNIPNPFSTETLIFFSIPRKSKVKLVVYDTQEQVVKVLLDEILQAGEHQALFNASRLPTGTYICRLTLGKETISIVLDCVR